MKHLKHLIDKRFLFGAILIIAFMAVTHYENEIPHDHVVETYYYANGHKSYDVIFCITEQKQLLFGKDHKRTSASDRYFNRE